MQRSVLHIFWETAALFQIPPWPTTGLTYEVAVTSCRQEIEAKLGLGMCGNVVSAQLTAAIDTCVEDVQVRNVCLKEGKGMRGQCDRRLWEGAEADYLYLARAADTERLGFIHSFLWSCRILAEIVMQLKGSYV